MTSPWRSLSIFTSEPDRLLTTVIVPCLAQAAPAVRSFWEPHVLGGTHWRVRLTGDGADALAAELDRRCRDDFAHAPSAVDPGYAPARAAALEREECGTTSGEAARYRVNVVEHHAYPDAMRTGLTPAAIELADRHREQVCRLALPFTGRRSDAFAAMLQAFWVHALTVTGGDLAQGCVSFRSHWAGFAATCPDATVLDRIETAFATQGPALQASLAEVRRWHDGAPVDPLRAAWCDRVRDQMRDMAVHVAARLAAGDAITSQAESVAEQTARAAEARRHIRRPEPFLDLVWEDPRFLASIRFSPEFLQARAMTNLLYMWLPLMRLSALDRHVLCRFAFGTVEQALGVDLADLLVENRAHIIALAPSPADAP